MKKYTSDQLQELANGVFVDDPKAASVYADENGTFKTVIQYDLLPEESAKGEPCKKDFSEFKNPGIDKENPNLEAKLSAVMKERDDYRAQLDTANAELAKVKKDLEQVNQQLLNQ